MDGQAGKQDGADGERGCVQSDRPPGADRRHERTADDRPCDVGDADGEEEEGVRLLQAGAFDRLRRQPSGRGLVERRGGTVHRREHDEVPELCCAGDQERCEHRLAREAHQVGGDHQLPPRQPVGPDSTGQHEQDERRGARGEHEPEGRRRAADLENRERQRDRRDVVADHRHAPREKQPPERPLPQRRQTRPEAHP